MNLYFCQMLTSGVKQVVLRNAVGLIALLVAYYIPDRHSLAEREGFSRFSPYLFLVLMYAWIVFHNAFLFGRLYLNGKKRAYFWVAGLTLAACSLNMHFILVYGFNHPETLPQLLSFWVFTLTGLGVYVIFRYLRVIENYPLRPTHPMTESTPAPTHLICNIDGEEKQIAVATIIYIESLENYIKVITAQKSHIVRLSLKDAEAKLPKPGFLRISRTHLINRAYLTGSSQDWLEINRQQFKIGKVYKRYVQEQLSRNAAGAN